MFRTSAVTVRVSGTPVPNSASEAAGRATGSQLADERPRDPVPERPDDRATAPMTNAASALGPTGAATAATAISTITAAVASEQLSSAEDKRHAPAHTVSADEVASGLRQEVEKLTGRVAELEAALARATLDAERRYAAPHPGTAHAVLPSGVCYVASPAMASCEYAVPHACDRARNRIGELQNELQISRNQEKDALGRLANAEAKRRTAEKELELLRNDAIRGSSDISDSVLAQVKAELGRALKEAAAYKAEAIRLAGVEERLRTAEAEISHARADRSGAAANTAELSRTKDALVESQNRVAAFEKELRALQQSRTVQTPAPEPRTTDDVRGTQPSASVLSSAPGMSRSGAGAADAVAEPPVRRLGVPSAPAPYPKPAPVPKPKSLVSAKPLAPVSPPATKAAEQPATEAARVGHPTRAARPAKIDASAAPMASAALEKPAATTPAVRDAKPSIAPKPVVRPKPVTLPKPATRTESEPNSVDARGPRSPTSAVSESGAGAAAVPGAAPHVRRPSFTVSTPAALKRTAAPEVSSAPTHSAVDADVAKTQPSGGSALPSVPVALPAKGAAAPATTVVSPAPPPVAPKPTVALRPSMSKAGPSVGPPRWLPEPAASPATNRSTVPAEPSVGGTRSEASTIHTATPMPATKPSVPAKTAPAVPSPKPGGKISTLLQRFQAPEAPLAAKATSPRGQRAVITNGSAVGARRRGPDAEAPVPAAKVVVMTAEAAVDHRDAPADAQPLPSLTRDRPRPRKNVPSSHRSGSIGVTGMEETNDEHPSG